MNPLESPDEAPPRQADKQAIRTAIVGLGKMGLSHLAILRAHPGVEMVGGCDALGYLRDVLTKYTGLPCYDDFDEMLDRSGAEAVVVATPSHLHSAMVEKAIGRGLHVFCEKPFVLDCASGQRIVEAADRRRLVTQVGYHYRFVGAFREAARLVRSGALGGLHHVRVEAYGPVVLRPKGTTWRGVRAEGGGALYDYACHAIDLVNFVVGVPEAVDGVVRNSIFSRDVEDEVYCTLHFRNGSSGQLCVNWSDGSFRKMSTTISVWGSNGRVTADRQECKVFLQSDPGLPAVEEGWTVRNTTELSNEVWFYLRGEEYSAQIDYFVQSIGAHRIDGENTFRSALSADRVIAMIASSEPRVQRATGADPGGTAAPRRTDTVREKARRVVAAWKA